MKIIDWPNIDFELSRLQFLDFKWLATLKNRIDLVKSANLIFE